MKTDLDLEDIPSGTYVEASDSAGTYKGFIISNQRYGDTVPSVLVAVPRERQEVRRFCDLEYYTQIERGEPVGYVFNYHEVVKEYPDSEWMFRGYYLGEVTILTTSDELLLQHLTKELNKDII